MGSSEIALISIVALVLYVWMVYLFVRLCRKVDSVSSDTVTAARYINMAFKFGIHSPYGRKCLSLALFFVRQGKIGNMPIDILRDYQPGEDYIAYLEKYIVEKLGD